MQDLGLGEVNPELSPLQRLRYSLSVYLARETLTKTKIPEDLHASLEIRSGESVRSICHQLSLLHPSLNERLCRSYLVYRGADRKLEPGTFSIPAGLYVHQVFDYIADPANSDRTLKIFAGWRLEEIADAIDQLKLKHLPSNSLLPKMKEPGSEFISTLQLNDHQSLEGYLLPGEYTFGPQISSEELLWQLSAHARELLTSGALQFNYKGIDLSPNETLTLASIIQRETIIAEEMPRIASVFFNRLAIDMPLQTDPTVQYALGYDAVSGSWWKAQLTIRDLETNSPYNTYRVTGLPPSPISSPSREAIKAVLNPESTEFLYFRAKCDGSGEHIFSFTYQEHLEKACP